MQQQILQPKRTVLALDDDEANLFILEKAAKSSGYDVKPFSSSEEALSYMSDNPKSINIAIIDKMMPKINGIEMLKRMKKNNVLKYIPVIIQTGDVGLQQMHEGLESGAFYYLTKPFVPETLSAILKSAESECNLFDEMASKAVSEHKKFVRMLSKGEFTLKTFSDARFLSALLGQSSASPSSTARGLMELMFNAIEHDNLEMGYEKKRECLLNNTYNQEIVARLANERYQKRTVRVEIENSSTDIQVNIIGSGIGFDWKPHMTEDPGANLNMPNGRGIAIAVKLLGNISYNAEGTEVSCKIEAAAS